MISDIFTWWRKICWKFISLEYKSGKDGCKTRLEAAIISDILFIWSGKFNFYQEKVREFWKVMPVATMKDTLRQRGHDYTLPRICTERFKRCFINRSLFNFI